MDVGGENIYIKIHEILRLKYGHGLSNRDVAGSVSVSPSTIAVAGCMYRQGDFMAVAGRNGRRVVRASVVSLRDCGREERPTPCRTGRQCAVRCGARG